MPAGSSHAASPRNGRPPWRWPSTSKRSSGKATTPFEPHVLFLSELALFGAQTLRCPLQREMTAAAQEAPRAPKAKASFKPVTVDQLRDLKACQTMIKPRFEPLTIEQVCLLRAHADKYGSFWKLALQFAWHSGKVDPQLLSLRDTHGQRWLAQFRFPGED